MKRRTPGQPINEDDWHREVVATTGSVVRRQREVGLDAINNGEQPLSFDQYVANRLSGIDGTGETYLWDDLQDYPDYAEAAFSTDVIELTIQPAVTGPVAYTGAAACRQELETFADCPEAADATFEDMFVTTASPGIAVSLVNEHYDSHREFVSPSRRRCARSTSSSPRRGRRSSLTPRSSWLLATAAPARRPSNA